ncbi:hypothetical protein [Burkholderia vietnamiensis]|uniref:hypothetical protein n=1 Tax=Burkholderia vietnamiensis TaxID=60552 RepID=UPI001FC8C837|nr:hypothetical protein [Burkholderia vietnamiensis]
MAFEHRGRTWAVHRSTLSDPHTPALFSVSQVETGRSVARIMEVVDRRHAIRRDRDHRPATAEQWAEFFPTAKSRARARRSGLIDGNPAAAADAAPPPSAPTAGPSSRRSARVKCLPIATIARLYFDADELDDVEGLLHTMRDDFVAHAVQKGSAGIGVAPAGVGREVRRTPLDVGVPDR